MARTNIVAFHPVRDGLFDTLNCADTLASSMQKHTLCMLPYVMYYFFVKRNLTLIVQASFGAAHAG